MSALRQLRLNTRLNENGLSLIEVLAAMIIAALGILALAPMMVVSIRANGQADDLTLATMQAQTTLETLKQQDPLPPIPYTNDIVDAASGLTRHVRIDNHASDGTIPTGLNRLSVTVTWTDKSGIDRTIDYSSYRAQ